MKNLNNPDHRKLIYDRIAKLTPESKGRWGKMNVNQMLRHLSDALRMQWGEIEVKDTGNSITHTLFKWVTLAGMPPPKNAETFPEINEVAKGVNPDKFAEESETLISMIRRSLEMDKPFYHPLFGTMSVSQLGKLNYNHMNHHLKQFGV
jgi:hypothetical protein